jgi:uncharacterized membrane protein YhaH (DUF805 family)
VLCDFKIDVILSVIYIIVLCAKEGTKGPNKYGPDPKKRELSVENHLIG